MCAQPAIRERTVEAPAPRVPHFVIQDAAGAQNFLQSLGIQNPGQLSVIPISSELYRVREDYQGLPVHGLMGNPPPVAVRVSDEVFRRASPSAGADAVYIPNSNIIFVSESATRDPNHLSEVLLHEINHYASWRGHGFDVIFRSKGKDVSGSRIDWMEEGFANFLSSGLAGRTGERIAYPYETLTAVMLCYVSGGDANAIREALSTGDFRNLQRRVDSKLGNGTFEILMGARPTPDGGRITNGAEAFDFLSSRSFDRNPPVMDERLFFSDTRVRRAMATLADRASSGGGAETHAETPIYREVDPRQAIPRRR